MFSLRMMKRRRRYVLKCSRVTFGLAAAAALLAVGCQPKASPTPPPTPRTAVEKLEALVAGLDDLLDSLPSADGVTVQSKVTHRLIKPANADASPEAEITIETKRFFVLAPQATQAVEEPNSLEDAEEKMVEAEAKADTAIVKNSEKKVYGLAYLDDRWQLKTELSDVSEQILFDRALRMQ